MSGKALDTVVTAETPEGILLELRPAGLSPRFFAFLIDWLIRLVALYAVGMVIGIAGMTGIAAAALTILWFLLEWFYPVVFELSRSGSTPGKRVFGLRVVMDNGLPITPGASLTRNLLRVADFLPALFGFAIVSMLLRKDCKRLGDIAAATLVIHDTRPAPKIELNQVEPIAPVRPLSPDDQAAVIALAARAPTLTAERLDELAALAAPISGDAGRSGPEVTRRVLGVAMYLLGRRA
ncbi:MAG: RDD family protein [Gammaproteobacteria bacterium]